MFVVPVTTNAGLKAFVRESIDDMHGIKQSLYKQEMNLVEMLCIWNWSKHFTDFLCKNSMSERARGAECLRNRAAEIFSDELSPALTLSRILL